MQTPGIPDLVAFVTFPRSQHVSEHRTLWIEVKRPGETRSDDQDSFRWNALERAGCEHVTGGVPEVVDWLKARGVVK